MRHSRGKRTAHRCLQLAVVAWVCFGATGCRHKIKPPPPPLLPAPSTVPLVPAPEPSTPPLVQPVPVKQLPTPPANPIRKKKKRKPAVIAVPAPAPVEGMSNAPPSPPGDVVGALSAGGDAAPAAQQKAASSIGQVEKRLTGLPSATLVEQKDGVARVRNFLRQAHDALNSGDFAAAATLADKAKVLLDDLLK